MSGHNKWSSIKHKKGAADAKRGKLFTKLIKEIIVAAKMGGGDIDTNARLRTAVQKARDANMPKDNIERGIKKGCGDLEGEEYFELTYEGYGLGGVALLISALTDNKNRTAADVRSILSKGGGNLGESGCVSYLFKRKGVINLDAEKYSEDEVFNAALEAGAEDVSTEGDTITVLCEPDDFEAVCKGIKDAGLEISESDISMVPDTYISLDKDKTIKCLKLIEKLDDHDDVQNVYSNLDIPDDMDLSELDS